ncbi:AcrR family transcriptional regulator [Paraburkholderia youngii]
MPSRTTHAASSPATAINEPRATARSTTPERILDTAERLFAMHGYFGTSIRDIMQSCGMELSLARYHFGSKDALFQQAIGRRAAVISRQVIESLEAGLAPLRGKRPDVETIVTALSAPAFAHLTSGDPGWRNYLRLLTQIGCLLDACWSAPTSRRRFMTNTRPRPRAIVTPSPKRFLMPRARPSNLCSISSSPCSISCSTSFTRRKRDPEHGHSRRRISSACAPT